MSFFSFTKLENRRATQVLVKGLVPAGEGAGLQHKYCVHMYVNRKQNLIKLFQEWGRVDKDGGGEYELL
jgi:hypothetical protein